MKQIVVWFGVLLALGVQAAAAPVLKEPVDPKAVALPEKCHLCFAQGKWLLCRHSTPVPRGRDDKADRATIRYYLAPLGVEKGRLVFEAECDIFTEPRPMLITDDRDVLFTSVWGCVWYDPKNGPLATGADNGSAPLLLPGSKRTAGIKVANEFGCAAQFLDEKSNAPLYYVPLKGTEFQPDQAVLLSKNYGHSFEWNVKIDGRRIAWGEGVYDAETKVKWSPLQAKRKPELRALSGDTVVYEALAKNGRDKEVIAFDAVTQKVLSVRPRKDNELLVGARDRLGLFFRSTGAGDAWEVFGADLADAAAKDIFATPIGDHKSVPTHYLTRDGVRFYTNDGFKSVGWNGGPLR